jgi:hypothetical protein
LFNSTVGRVTDGETFGEIQVQNRLDDRLIQRYGIGKNLSLIGQCASPGKEETP